MKRLLVSLVLFAFAASLGAAELGKRGKKEYMGACGEREAGLIYAITDGSNAASCDSAQTVGALRIYCSCTPDGEGSYVWGLLDSALGGEAPDLSAYVLLAGDTDGQLIQGIAGENQARVEIGVSDASSVKLIGAGATSGFIYAYTDGIYGESADGLSYLDIYDGTIDLDTSGSLVLRGGANTTLGTVASTTSLRGANISVNSQQTPPTNANDSCTPGDFIPTTGFIYFCVATDTWKRVAIATW